MSSNVCETRWLRVHAEVHGWVRRVRCIFTGLRGATAAPDDAENLTTLDGPPSRCSHGGGSRHGGVHHSVFVGPDWAALMATFVFVIVPTLAFVLVVSRSAGESVVCSVLATFSLVFLCRCALVDPGIIPAQPLPSETAEPPPMTVKEVVVLRGESTVVERRWCTACNLYRPLRTVHCRFCNACITRRDHHCPWTGTCVGERNYRYYFWFLVACTMAALFLLVSCVRDLVERFHRLKEMSMAYEDGEPSWVHLVVKSIWETRGVGSLLIVFGCMALVPVGGLVRFHVMLMMHGATTTEEAKGGQYAHHPFSEGNATTNMVRMLCGPMPPSLLSAAGHARLQALLHVKAEKECEGALDDSAAVADGGAAAVEMQAAPPCEAEQHPSSTQ